ncbi:MAG: alpha/beta fold hydrolase, partial [Pseudomonadota bacterium]
HKMWDPQVADFQKNYQVITYDIRGHGQSSFVDNEAKDIGDLIAILDHLQIERVHLVGLSLGGAFAIDAALTYPSQNLRSVLKTRA